MATQTVEFRAASGATLTAKLFAVGSDSVVQTASAVVESGNRKGTYASLFADVAAGEYELIAFSGAIPVCRWFVTLTLSTATFQAYDATVRSVQDKTGYSLATAPPTAAAIADAVWDELHADHTTDGTYGDSVLIAANNNRTVQVTGSNHVAADIHELQPAVITSAAFATNWLTAAGLATDAVTEIQSGLATATNLLIAIDRVSFCLSALAGSCSDAQTAAETYTLSIGGNTYTLDYSGLDASGNRSTTTLTKA